MFSFNWFRKSFFSVDIDASVISELIKKKNLEELDIPVYVTAVDLQNAREIVFDSGDIKIVCKASCALVPLFKPVKYNGKTLVDGGFYNHMPYQPLKKYKIPMLGVNLHPLMKKPSKPKMMSYLKKVIAIRMFITADEQREEYDYYISSDKINKYSILSLKSLDALFELGYKEAQEVLN